MNTEISELIGKTIVEITGKAGEDQIKISCSDGTKYLFFHDQDCCESVTIEDIVGDIEDLVGSPILKAEEVTSDANPEGIVKDYQESFTWTFYHFATKKGHVTIRWYGESNGYYSEGVDFVKIAE